MSSPRSIRVVIADSHPVYRHGVRALLSKDPMLEIVGEAGDGERALALVATMRPDVLLLEFNLPRLSGIEVLRRLTATRAATRSILVTATIESSEIQTALVLGAWGVVGKDTASDVLLTCIRNVMRGEPWIGVESVDAIVSGLRPRPPKRRPRTLTSRELDVARMVARGTSNKEIASDLGLTEQTVKNYLRSIFKKLHVANRVELAVHIAKNPGDEISPSE